MSNKEETKEETKESEKTSTFSFKQSHLTKNDLLAMGNYIQPTSADELYDFLLAAMSIELSTLPLYLQAYFSIKSSYDGDALDYFFSIIMQEMGHMNIVSNLILSIFGGDRPVVCTFDIDYSEGQLPQQIRPDLTIALDRYTTDQMLLFAQIECAAPLASSTDTNPFVPQSGQNTADVEFVKNSEIDTIGSFYNALINGIVALSNKGEISFNNDNFELQRIQVDQVPVIQNLNDAQDALNMIINQGEGHSVEDWSKGVHFAPDDERPHFIKFVELSVGKQITEVKESTTPASSTDNIRLTFKYSEEATLEISEDDIQPQTNFETPDNEFMGETYTNMLNKLEVTLNDPKGNGIPGDMNKLSGAFDDTMKNKAYPTWRLTNGTIPPSVFKIHKRATVLFLNKTSGRNFYQQNIRVQRAGTKSVNGIYKNTSYELLPSAVTDLDKKAKRGVGIVGYQHILSGSGTEYYITVSTAATKDVTTTSPTLSVYKLTLKDGSVTLLYTVTSKYGVLPDRTAFTYKGNEKGDKTSNPRIILHINDYIEPSKLVNAFSGVWYGDKGIDTMFIVNQDDPIDGPLGGSINKGFATSYNETVEYVPLSFGVLNPRSLSMKNPGGDPETAEVIYGVRLFRRVLSTLPNNDNTKDNPFKSGGTIHEETGYILFCYVNGILVRIAKSLAIPRVISVLANDDTPIITYLNGNLVIRTNLKAKATSETNLTWTVSNGTFPDQYGKVTEFEQAISLTYDEKKPNESSLMYLQFTPITFNNQNTPHTNKNFLTKQS